MMKRRLVALSAALCLAAVATPAHASKATTLYFANLGGCGADNPKYAFSLKPADGTECAPAELMVKGTGSHIAQAYAGGNPSVRLDAKRAITGTVYLAFFSGVSATPSLPGTLEATVTIRVARKTVAVIHKSGTVLPGGTFAIPVSAKLPPALNGISTKSIGVDIDFQTAVGVVGVTYSEPAVSKLVIPTR
jgi:hypothetical protein